MKTTFKKQVVEEVAVEKSYFIESGWSWTLLYWNCPYLIKWSNQKETWSFYLYQIKKIYNIKVATKRIAIDEMAFQTL